MMESAENAADSPDSDDVSPRSKRQKVRNNTPVKKRRIRGELSSVEKKQPGIKTFQEKWLVMDEYKGWLKRVTGDKNKAYCNACSATFGAGKSELDKHSKGAKHIQKVHQIQQQKPINQAFAATGSLQASQFDRDVKAAEIKLAAFFCEHNVAILVAEHLVQLCKNIFCDSAIAKKITLDRTKCTALMKNVLAKTEKEEIIEVLKVTKFSVLVDESTDISKDKAMCLLTKYVAPNTGLPRTSLLELIELDSKDCSAEALYGRFKMCLAKHGVPVKNCIGLGCDHANVMTGLNNSFYSRLKEDCPWLVLMDCICHSSHIAASHACKKLPGFIKSTLQRILSYTQWSRRSAILEEFQAFYSEEQRKLLHMSATRWLVMHSCVVRIFENLTALEYFFLECAAEDPKDREAPALHEMMKNPFFKAYLLFLKYTLNYFNKMNALFQHHKTLVHRLQSESNVLLTQICGNYMRENVLESIVNIDVAHPHFQVPLDKVYLGPGVVDALEKVVPPSEPSMTPAERAAARDSEIKTFRLRCLDFYITAAKQLKTYLPLKSEIIREAAFIDPGIALSKKARNDKFPDLPTLSRHFKDDFGLNIDELTEEWRRLPFDVPQDRVAELSAMEPDVFWYELSTMKNFKDEPKFSNLVVPSRLVMTLPHSNANAEEIFAIVTDTKTKKRNRMGSDTLDSICITRSAMRQKKTACYQYEVTKSHLSKHNSTMYK